MSNDFLTPSLFDLPQSIILDWRSAVKFPFSIMISQLLLSILFSMCSYMLYVQFLSPFFFISSQDTVSIWTSQEMVETETCLDLLDATKVTPSHSKVSKTTNDPVLINEGLAYFEEVALKESKSYYFPVKEKDENIILQISSVSGSPEIYISLNDPKPSDLKHHFKSQVGAGDVFSKEFRKLWKECTEECTLRISIFGATASVYNLRIHTDQDSPSLLAFGMPVTSQLNATKSDFYCTSVNTRDLYMRLQLLEGNAELFMAINKYEKTDLADDTQWKKPSRDSGYHFSKYGSMRAMGQTLEISTKDIRRSCPSVPCLALTNVVCLSDTCKYMLTVTQDDLVQLVERVPYTGELEGGKVAYHKFICFQEDSKILVSLTSLSDVDLEVFVSKGLEKRPTSQGNDWYQKVGKEGKLTISKISGYFSSGSSKGGYMLGVLGDRNTTYSISINTHPDHIIPLLPGVPVQAEVSDTVPQVYSFYHTQDNDLHLALTPIFGLAGLLVRTSSSEAELFNMKKLSEEVNWSTKSSGHNDFLTIKASDQYFCSKCTYVIGVYGENRNCSYSITAFSERDKVDLQAGIPHQDMVNAGKWRYFSFLLHDHTSRVDFSLMVYSGDADLSVISSLEAVSSTKTQWITTNVSKKHISITAEKSTLGEYTIGVLGNKDTYFSVTASSGLISLIGGWPGIYSIGNTNKRPLEFRLYVDELVTCKIRPLSIDFYPQVSTYLPSDVANNWLYTKDEYDMVYGELIIPFEPAAQLEERRIIVSGSWNNTSIISSKSFQITCVKGSTPMILLVGQPVFGIISTEEDKHRFQIYASEKSLLTFHSMTCVGETSLSISSNVTQEREDSLRTAESENPREGLVTALPNAFGRYYITIGVGKVANSSFQRAYYDFWFEKNWTSAVRSALGGVIQWSVVYPYTIQLEWSPLTYENGTVISELVQYLVYLANDPSFQLNSACAVRSAVFQNLAQLHDIDYSKTTEGQIEIQADVSLAVNILGVLSPESQIRPLVLSFQPSELYVSSWTLPYWAMLIIKILEWYCGLGCCCTIAGECWKARSRAKEREKQKKANAIYKPVEEPKPSAIWVVANYTKSAVDSVRYFVPGRRNQDGSPDMRDRVNRLYFLLPLTNVDGSWDRRTREYRSGQLQ